jgi:hypothetical protein
MRALVVVLAVLVAGCDGMVPFTSSDPITQDGLSLSSDQEVYRRGELARIRLVNNGPHTYISGVLVCADAERWDGVAWVEAHLGERACIALAVYTEPGSQSTAEIPLDVPRGSYRFVHTLSQEGSVQNARIATASFLVAG